MVAEVPQYTKANLIKDQYPVLLFLLSYHQIFWKLHDSRKYKVSTMLIELIQKKVTLYCYHIQWRLYNISHYLNTKYFVCQQ